MKPLKNLYSILGLSTSATEEEIKKAYKELAKKLHPDRNNGIETEQFKEITEAYDILSDKKKKAEYDKEIIGFNSNFEVNFENYDFTKDVFREYSMDLNKEDDSKLKDLFSKIK
jgi:chaperone protein DnaJ